MSNDEELWVDAHIRVLADNEAIDDPLKDAQYDCQEYDALCAFVDFCG